MSIDSSYTIPSSSPESPISGAGAAGAPAIRLSFVFAMLRVGPPWLRRAVGGAVMQGLGEPIENEVDRNLEGLRLRFPADGADEDALGLIGRERRILRGPGELASTFALRLRQWWDAHRIRGSAYALLRQLHAYFESTNNVPVTYVSNLGANMRIDSAGAIDRDGWIAPGWTGDGAVPPYWARFFLFFEFPGTTFSSPLVDENGDPILTEDGEAILTEVDLYALTASDLEEICAVPAEWSAAHIDRIYIALLPVDGILWGFPATLEWGSPGKTWGGGLAVVFTC